MRLCAMNAIIGTRKDTNHQGARTSDGSCSRSSDCGARHCWRGLAIEKHNYYNIIGMRVLSSQTVGSWSRDGKEDEFEHDSTSTHILSCITFTHGREHQFHSVHRVADDYYRHE